MMRTMQLLYASGGTDVMITDYMKGHRYGVINPRVEISKDEAISVLSNLKFPYMFWTEASLQKIEANEYFEAEKKKIDETRV